MNLTQLPTPLEVIAQNELNEVPSRLHNDIETVKLWLKVQRHLKARDDDRWILTFLRACKFSLERTKEKIERFLSMRTLAPEYFTNRNPFAKDIQYSFDNGITAILPTKVGEPCRFVMRLGPRDPNLMPFEAVIRLYFMLCDILLEECDNITICGASMLLDFKGVTYTHVAQCTLPLMKKAVMCLEGSYPIRTKAICIINVPSLAIPVYRLLQALLSKKLTERFHVYENDGGDDIYKYFPKDVLPLEYKGDGKSMSELSAEWKGKTEGYRDWFINDQQYCSDEKRRPKDSKFENELFGVSGSFRKLAID